MLRPSAAHEVPNFRRPLRFLSVFTIQRHPFASWFRRFHHKSSFFKIICDFLFCCRRLILISRLFPVKVFAYNYTWISFLLILDLHWFHFIFFLTSRFLREDSQLVRNSRFIYRSVQFQDRSVQTSCPLFIAKFLKGSKYGLEENRTLVRISLLVDRLSASFK